MNGAIETAGLVSVADYLAAEYESEVKHEYLGGMVYAMAGARNQHSTIQGNVFAALHRQLRGRPCSVFGSDTKVRIQTSTQTYFYYPDASVVCTSNAPDEVYQDRPVVLVEVLSLSTRRIDEREKKEAYLGIPTLKAYLLVEQEQAAVKVFRRAEQGFDPELYTGQDQVVPLPEVEVELPLSEVYDGAQFLPDTDLNTR